LPEKRQVQRKQYKFSVKISNWTSMKNVLLINLSAQVKEFFDGESRLPYNILSLASYIEKHCELNNVKVIFKQLDDYFENNFYIREIRFIPDLIGFTVLEPQDDDVKELYENIIRKAVSKYKSIYKDAMVIAGGPTAIVKKTIFINYFDAICMGEGEVPLAELIKAENKELYLKEKPYWYIRGKEYTELYLLQDLDSLPPINFDFIHDLFLKRGKVVNTYFSRGCISNCTFCSIGIVQGEKKFRQSGAKKMIEDLKYYLGKYNSFSLYMLDNILDITSPDVKEFLKFVIENKDKISLAPAPHNFSTSFFVHFLCIDEEGILLLKQLGVTEIMFRTDASCERVYKEIVNKKGSFETLKESIDLCKKHGLEVYINALVGFPGETEEEIKNVRKYYRNNFNVDGVYTQPVLALHGTKLWDLVQPDLKDTKKEKNMKTARKIFCVPYNGDYYGVEHMVKDYGDYIYEFYGTDSQVPSAKPSFDVTVHRCNYEKGYNLALQQGW
jgi:radical SAM superfamily enzyme YgiQ (UPF0313 family)